MVMYLRLMRQHVKEALSARRFSSLEQNVWCCVVCFRLDKKEEFCLLEWPLQCLNYLTNLAGCPKVFAERFNLSHIPYKQSALPRCTSADATSIAATYSFATLLQSCEARHPHCSHVVSRRSRADWSSSPAHAMTKGTRLRFAVGGGPDMIISLAMTSVPRWVCMVDTPWSPYHGAFLLPFGAV